MAKVFDYHYDSKPSANCYQIYSPQYSSYQSNLIPLFYEIVKRSNMLEINRIHQFQPNDITHANINWLLIVESLDLVNSCRWGEITYLQF